MSSTTRRLHRQQERKCARAVVFSPDRTEPTVARGAAKLFDRLEQPIASVLHVGRLRGVPDPVVLVLETTDDYVVQLTDVATALAFMREFATETGRAWQPDNFARVERSSWAMVAVVVAADGTIGTIGWAPAIQHIGAA